MAPREGAARSDGVTSPITSYVATVTGTLGQKTPLDSASVRARGGTPSLNSEEFQIRGTGPESWFGPSQPMAPFAPPGTGGRQWDYPFGLNLLYTPRGESEIPFAVLRSFADALPELRIAIEHRKAEVSAWEWDIQPILTAKDRRKQAALFVKEDPRVAEVKKYFRKPDKRHHFSLWISALLEDMLVVDAACIYPRYTFGGDLYSLDLVDGTTIKPLIDETGRQPMPEDGPAFQQVLHGVPAADFTLDELMYMPRNVRSGKLYGFSAVEWIILTINIALRRQVYTLDYYTDGSIPQGFYTLPKEWGPDQIASFQRWWDDILAGNLAGRRRLQFMPGGADGKFTETKQAPLKDIYDEWLMRLICAAFSVSPSPFVNDNTRATAQTIQLNTSQRGIASTKLWLKAVLDDIIQERLGYEDIEFVWSGGDEIDPLEQAQSLQVLISCGVKTVDEGRVELGLDPFGIGPTTQQPVIPLIESYKAQVENIKNPPPPPQLPAPGKQPGEATPEQPPPKGAKPEPKGAKEAVTPTAKLDDATLEAIRQEVAKLGAAPFDVGPSATKGSPDQPRDEHGRFAGGGSQQQYQAGEAAAFRPDASKPIAAEAQHYVLEQGRATGDEHIVGIDKDGNPVGVSRGEKASVGLVGALASKIADPSEQVVVHHNHPSDRSLSGSDVAMLSQPGLAAVWVHGQDGLTARASLTDKARGELQGSLTGQMALYRAYGTAEDRIAGAVRPQLTSNTARSYANLVQADLNCEVLRRAGVIDYRTSRDVGKAIDRFGLKDKITAAASRVAKGFYGSSKLPRDGGRAEPLRLRGDVGTAFGKAEGASRRNGAARRDDRQSGGDDRAAEGGRGALKYSEDQERDEHGRFAGGGGTATYDAEAKQWTRADGSPLPDHLAGTKIPPAWTDVQFAENPKSELLVVGKDEKGRPQYVYSDAHWSRVAAEKFARVDEMETKYQSMMAQNEANRASGDDRTQAHADALETVARMGIRPGSETDTKAEKQAYGATTLLGSHVVQTESGVRLQFTGKKGVDLNLPVNDKGLADRLVARAAEAGPDGKLFPGVSDASLRDYTHTMDGGDFKPKDFRTRLANDTARSSIASMKAPTDGKSYQKSVNSVGDAVSKVLGNTRTVALQSYINPAVFGGWRMHAKA